MNPPKPPSSRPSVPHSMTRTPTQPQRQLPVYDAQQEQPPDVDPDADELETLARRMSGGGFSAEDLLRFGFILSRRAVIDTRNDENLQRVAQSGLDQSKTIMTLTGELRRARKIIGLLIGIAGSIGGLAGACAQGYQERKVEVLEPIAVVEGKAARAEKKAKEVELTTEERLDAADARILTVEKALGDVNSALKANTDAVLGIAAKLDAPPASSKKKP